MFIDEWYENDYYRQLPLGYHTNLTFGQIFWTHAYYPHENLQLWRPVSSPGEPTKTIAKEFQLQAAGSDAFDRPTPLHVPKLETNEEFLAIRAKRRPVVLLQPESSLSNEDNAGYRGKINRRLCLVAQIYGLADTKTQQEEFKPQFIERMRRMEFPELLFLPKKAGIFEVDSMMRLDGVQSVFVPHLEPTQFALSESLCDVVRWQLRSLLTGDMANEYADLREFFLS